MIHLPLANVDVAWYLLVLLGLIVGVLSGFFGVGGGFLSTPALNVLGLPIAFAVGSGLPFTLGTSTLGAMRHRRLGNVDYVLGLVVGGCSVIGVELAKGLVLQLEQTGSAGTLIRLGYIGLLVSASLSMLRGNLRRRSVDTLGDDEPMTKLARAAQALALPPHIRLTTSQISMPLWALVAVGALIGLLSGFLGVGGGFLLVPVFIYGLGIPTRVAIGSSLLAVITTSGYGTFTYATAGRVELLAAVLMFVGAAFGTPVGALATRFASGRRIRALFGLMLLIGAIGIGLKQATYDAAAGVLLFGSATIVGAIILVQFLRGLRRERRPPGDFEARPQPQGLDR
ncbi:MAG: sulfite exporter TauE/SafE family protein [Chloroflexi bacterium]|nr:sulfite exporter TauE/SafE family protein [Chloroflexota bacterium]